MSTSALLNNQKSIRKQFLMNLKDNAIQVFKIINSFIVTDQYQLTTILGIKWKMRLCWRVSKLF